MPTVATAVNPVNDHSVDDIPSHRLLREQVRGLSKHKLLRRHARFRVWPLPKNSPCREQSGSGALGQCLVK